MLCVNVSCNDASDHMVIDSQCVGVMQISCESANGMIISSAQNDFMQIWSSYVCSIGNQEHGLMQFSRDKITFRCDEGFDQIKVITKLDWYIEEDE